MARVTFARDYSYRIDALTAVKYRGDRAYTVTPEVEQAARSAGALKEKARDRSGRRRGKGGTDASQG